MKKIAAIIGVSMLTIPQAFAVKVIEKEVAETTKVAESSAYYYTKLAVGFGFGSHLWNATPPVTMSLSQRPTLPH